MTKRWMTAVLLLALCGLAFPAGAQAQSSAVVRCRLDASTLPSGGEARLAIEVLSVTNLYGYQLVLNAPTAAVEFLDGDPGRNGINAALGSFLSPDFVVANSVDAAKGQLALALVQMNPSQPKSGSGELASIRIRTKTAAAVNFVLSGVILSDPQGNALAVSVEGCTLNAPGSPTPSATVTTAPTATQTPTATQPGATAAPTAVPSATLTPTLTPPPAVATSAPTQAGTAQPSLTPSLAAGTATSTSTSEPTPTGMPAQASATAAPTATPATPVPGAPAATARPTASAAPQTAPTEPVPAPASKPGSPVLLIVGGVALLALLAAAGGYAWMRRK